MALNANMEEINVLIEQFKQDTITLKDYCNIKNYVKNDYDPKLSVKIGKRMFETVKKIIELGGIAQFCELLNNKNILIAASAAEYLYPIEPEKCLKILNKYLKSLKDPSEIMRTKDIINGFKNNEKFFVEPLNELFGMY